MAGINAELVKLAAWRAHREKQGFVPAGGGAPPGGDPAAMGGAPPMDPSMMGGPPPGGAPPMDPSMMGGGAPPMDPSMMGGPPPGGGGPPVDPAMLAAMGGGIGGGGAAGGGGDVRSIIREELSAAGLLPQGGKTGAGGKAPKPDINTIATDVFQLKKMFLHFLRIQGIELPPDILDGPNRDPLTGAPATSPTGGSDVKPGSSEAGPSSAIKPIEPMQGAFPAGGTGGGGGGGIGGEKTSGVRVGQEVSGGRRVMSKAAAVAQMFKQRREAEAS